MVTYLFSYCYVIVQSIYCSLFAMGFVTVYGMFCIQHFLTEQSGSNIQEPTNTKDLSCNALRNKQAVSGCDVRCPGFVKFQAGLTCILKSGHLFCFPATSTFSDCLQIS